MTTGNLKNDNTTNSRPADENNIHPTDLISGSKKQ